MQYPKRLNFKSGFNGFLSVIVRTRIGENTEKWIISLRCHPHTLLQVILIAENRFPIIDVNCLLQYLRRLIYFYVVVQEKCVRRW